MSQKLGEEEAQMRLSSEDVAVCKSMGVSAQEFCAAKERHDADGDKTDKPEYFESCSYCATKHETDRHAGEFADCAKCKAAHGNQNLDADPESDSTGLDSKKKLSPEQAAVNAALGISDKEFGAHHRS